MRGEITLKLLNLQIEEDGGVEGGEEVAHGQGEPNAIELGEAQGRRNLRQDEEGGHEEDELTRKGHIDALTSLADALEEVARDHLEPDDGEEGHVDAHTMGCDGDKFIVSSEEFHDEFGKKLA